MVPTEVHILGNDGQGLCSRIGELFALHHNGSGWTNGDASTTSVAATGIDEGWFARVDLQNRLGATDIPCLAFSTRQTKVVDDLGDGRGLSFDRLYHHCASLPSSAPKSGRHYALHTPLGYVG